MSGKNLLNDFRPKIYTQPIRLLYSSTQIISKLAELLYFIHCMMI